MTKTIPINGKLWQLVPVEVTEEMHIAAVRVIQNCQGNDDFPPRVYAAMLAAAPEALGLEPFGYFRPRRFGSTAGRCWYNCAETTKGAKATLIGEVKFSHAVVKGDAA